MLSVDCFVFSISFCTLGLLTLVSSYFRTRREKDCRSLSSSTLRWFTWVCAGSFLFSLWVRISLPTGAASPPETVRCSLILCFAHLANKRFNFICPPHLGPCSPCAVTVGVNKSELPCFFFKGKERCFLFCFLCLFGYYG